MLKPNFQKAYNNSFLYFYFNIDKNQSEVSHVSSHGANNSSNPTSKTTSQFSTTAKDLSLHRRERKTITRMLSILGSLFACNFPALLLFMHASYYDVGYMTVSYYFPWTRTVVFLNTIINPVLYCYRNEHFRRQRSLLYRQHMPSNSAPSSSASTH
jgi:hypothetical protein